MKRIWFVAICVMAVLIGCKQKGQTASADATDSLTAVIDSIIEENDTTPMPMYLMHADEGRYMLMLYWADIEEPQKTEENADWFDVGHRGWVLQEMFRRNAAQYTNLLTDDGVVKVKFVDEVLKDPDGNTPSIGEIHGRDDIPSLCARFEYANAKDEKGELGGVIVTDSYLKIRQRLTIKYDQSAWAKPKPFPEAVVKQLEKKYGMKVAGMRVDATFGDYLWGKLQFEGEYKGAPKDKYDADRKFALALDVLVKGDEVFANEALGYYDPSFGCTWNADDDGEYVGCRILAAFEGPKGLELFYRRNAPESAAIGMFYLRDGQLIQHNYETYHYLIDEDAPLWQQDFAEMKKLYVKENPENEDVELTKWARCHIDYENDWIWLRDAKDENGAMFIRDADGKFKLIAVETPKLKFSRLNKDNIYYLRLSGSAGGPSTYSELFGFKDGKQVEHFNALFVAGEIDGCELNGKELTAEAGKAYIDRLPADKQIDVWFQDIKK